MSSAVSSASTRAVGPVGALRFFASGTGVIRSERWRIEDRGLDNCQRCVLRRVPPCSTRPSMRRQALDTGACEASNISDVTFAWLCELNGSSLRGFGREVLERHDQLPSLGAWAAEILARVGSDSGGRQGAGRSPGCSPGQAPQRRLCPNQTQPCGPRFLPPTLLAAKSRESVVSV